MRKLIFIFSLLAAVLFPVATIAQPTLRTLYYNRHGQGVATPELADFRRTMTLPNAEGSAKIFRDFYLSGELLREGQYVTIDSVDDQRSAFEGEVVTYYKDGAVKSKYRWAEGAVDGEAVEYAPDGSSWRVYHYDKGTPVGDYYELHTAGGEVVRYNLADDTPVLEVPSPEQRQIEYQAGKAYQSYRMNGVQLAAALDRVNDVSDSYRFILYLHNVSGQAIDFQPEQLRAQLIDKKDQERELEVWTAEAYEKKAKSLATLTAVLTGISAGLSVADAAIDPTSTSVAMAATSTLLADKEGERIEHRYQLSQESVLRRTTLHPGEELRGYIMIHRKKGKKLTVFLTLAGMEYPFEWDVLKLKAN